MPSTPFGQTPGGEPLARVVHEMDVVVVFGLVIAQVQGHRARFLSCFRSARCTSGADDRGTGAASAGRARESRTEQRQRDSEGGLGLFRTGARPATAEITRFSEARRERFGVEPICRELQVAPQAYYAARQRPRSARRIRDEALQVQLRQVHAEHFGVYGARKLWRQLTRLGQTQTPEQVA